MGKYSQDEMHAAFTAIQDKEHWKNPIKTVVEGEVNKDLITESVIHFTGSVPSFKQVEGGTLIQADGYFLTIGA